jgi:hypothetical protein
LAAHESRGSADISGMKITIQRDDVSYGPYTIEQVKELISQRRFAHLDLARVDGANHWYTLENLIIQDSFRRQRVRYIEEMNAKPQKDSGKNGKYAKRWQWKP